MIDFVVHCLSTFLPMRLNALNDTQRPMDHGKVRVTARTNRHCALDVKRADAARVARFHCESIAQARVFSALTLPSPFVDPVKLIDQIVVACNGDLGKMFYVNATLPRHELLFESYFSDGRDEDKLRTAITTQQIHENDARTNATDNARYLLSSFNQWIYMLRVVKRRKKNVLQCTAFGKRFRQWAHSLYLLMHGSRRLRFLAVSRRKRHQSADGRDDAYDNMF